MSVLDSLNKEHLLFAGLVDRLERAAAFDEEAARREFRKLLLLLLPALDKHEEIEDIVFGHPYAGAEGARRLLDEVEAQHRKIQSLREELEEALRDTSDCPFSALKALVERLASKLRVHFATEENRLWPHFRSFTSRSVNGGLARKADERVKGLEADIRKNSELIEDYLGGSR